MTEVVLHATPGGRDVVREQLRAVGLSLRREALVAAVVLAVVTLVIGAEIARGGSEMQFRSDSPSGTGILSFLFAFAVWKREQRFGPAFLWTLPVDRRRMALAKVLAGWVWMMTVWGVFVAWNLALALAAHTPSLASDAGSWLVRAPGATAMYLLGSAMVLGLRHPLRWLLGTGGVFFILSTLTDLLGRTANGEWRIVALSGVLRWAIYGPYGLRTLLDSSGFFSATEQAAAAWRTLPNPAQFITASILWLGAGVIALWAAASRHRERRNP